MVLSTPNLNFSSIKNTKKQTLGAPEPGGVENKPTKDNNGVLLRNQKVGDCGKGGNFLLNLVLMVLWLHCVV